MAAAAFVLVRRLPQGVETDLVALVGAPPGGVLREVTAATAGHGRVLVEGTNATEVVDRAKAIRAEFGLAASGTNGTNPIALFAAHGGGLLSEATRNALREGRTRDVADAALARLFGPMPPLTSPKTDPFQLVPDFLSSALDGFAPGWTLRDGALTRETEAGARTLVPLDLAGCPAPRLAAFLDETEPRPNDGGGGMRIRCSGAPFHAARCSEKAKGDIGLLSFVSLFCALGAGWWLFRSFRFVPGLTLMLGAAFALAAATTFLVHPRPHVLTFVFGTTLIGLAVDYFYHARSAVQPRELARPLACALATSLTSFAPLLFAPVAALRQMALFTLVGLAAAWALARFCAAGTISAPPAARHLFRMPRCGVLLLLGIALAGLPRFKTTDDPAGFYRPDARLANDEKRIAAVLAVGATNRLAWIRGPDVQTALEREEAAGLRGLSVLLPSLKRQRENADLIRALHRREGRRFAADTGLPVSDEPKADAFLDESALALPPLASFAARLRTSHGLLAPCPAEFASSDPAIHVVEPRRLLEERIAALSREALRLFAAACAALALLLVCVFRRKAFRVAAPVVCALAATAGTLGWCGIPATFFTTLSFFALAGLGLDYAIFSLAATQAHPASRRATFCSFLTSLAGFGLLACVDFPVLRQMGLVFAFGLTYCWLFAAAFAPRAENAAGKADWQNEREHGAGRWRLAFLWCVYRLLGKDAVKILCVPIVACVFPFARGPRAALRRFHAVVGGKAPSILRLYRQFLSFAWGVVDKTDVCTTRKNLPRLAVVEDAGWRAFASQIAARKGVFLVSTHLGTAEALPCLAETCPAARAVLPDGAPPVVHAFLQMGHDPAFRKTFLRHFAAPHLVLHAVEDVGVETAVALQEATRRGECILMAGDRAGTNARAILRHAFFGREVLWPKGVFALAKLVEAPVFFVTCIRTGWNAYRVRFAEGPATGTADKKEILARYVRFLEEETRQCPDEWFNFHDVFARVAPSTNAWSSR